MQKSNFSTRLLRVLVVPGLAGEMFAVHQGPSKTSYMNILRQNPEFQQGVLKLFFSGLFQAGTLSFKRAPKSPDARLQQALINAAVWA